MDDRFCFIDFTFLTVMSFLRGILFRWILRYVIEALILCILNVTLRFTTFGKKHTGVTQKPLVLWSEKFCRISIFLQPSFWDKASSVRQIRTTDTYTEKKKQTPHIRPLEKPGLLDPQKKTDHQNKNQIKWIGRKTGYNVA